MFWEVMTEELVGKIPSSQQEPATDFLKTAGPKWEKWLLYHSWKIQRKAAIEAKHHDSYLGMLAFLGFLLHLATRATVKTVTRETVVPAPVKAEDPLIGVADFMQKINTQ